MAGGPYHVGDRDGTASASRRAGGWSRVEAAARRCGGGDVEAHGGATETGPERARGGVNRVEEMAANLTGDLDSEERRRGGGATERGGVGRRSSPRALQGGEGGRVRLGIGRGGCEEGPCARNRGEADRRRRIDGGGGNGAGEQS